MTTRTNASHIGRLCRTAGVLVLFTLLALAGNSARAGDYAVNFVPGQYVSTTGRITTVPFTIEAWIKQPSFDAENQILSQYAAGTRLITYTANGKLGFRVGDSAFVGTTTLTASQWYHVAFVRNAAGTGGSVYINGSLERIGTLGGGSLVTANIVIGRLTTSSGSGFRGLIADVRVWNYARTQQEIADSLTSRLTGSESGLIHYWRLNDGSGATAINRSSNAHGTLNGTTWSYSSDLPLIEQILEGTWMASTSGVWSDPANWLNQDIAQGVNSVAFFTNQPPTSIVVTNDIASLLLGNLNAHSAASYTFRGNAVTLTNDFTSARLTTTNGAHTLELPLATTATGLAFDTATGASWTVADIVSGSGTISINTAASGGGTVTLTDLNTYTGPTVLGCGTLLVDALADGGAASPLGASSAAPSNLRLGPGTFRYTGGNATTDRGFTVQAGSSPARAAVLHTDADLTFGGQIQAASGCLIKTGSGTLAFTYPGHNVYAAAEGNPNAFQNLNANGDSPTAGFPGLVISNGKIVMGAPGQTNQFANRIDIGAYTTTNANAETTGELEIAGGVFTCPTTFSVGRHNGTSVTAGPEGLSARFTVSGGYALVSLLAMGNNSLLLPGYNARPVVEVSGGELEISNYLNASEHAGSFSTINVRNTGVLRFTGTTDYCARIGISGTAVITLSDNGFIHASTDFRLAWSPDGNGTLNLDGGILVARNITRGSGTNAFLNFNGGVFKPHTAGRTLSGLTAANVRAGGARIDTSLADYTVAQDLTHDDALGETPDGGLVKLGNGTLVFSSTNSTYAGPTLVSGGTLRVAGALPASSDVLVADAGTLQPGGSGDKTLAVASLAVDGNGTLAFAFSADSLTNDRLAVAASPALGNARIALLRADTGQPFTQNGTYTLLTYSGDAPDVGGLACANPVFGKSYAFAAADGAVTVTIGLDTANASVWNVDADGAWATGGNWTVAPVPGGAVRFDNAISAPRTVTTAGQTVGDIYFNSAFTYTLGGSGLTLTPGAGIFVEAGNHVQGGVLTLPGDTPIVFAPATSLRLGHIDGASAAISAQGDGSLTIDAIPDTLQSLALAIQELVLDFNYALNLPVSLSRTLSLRPSDSRTVTLNGAISGSGGLTKSGSSFLIPTAANTYTGPTAVSAGTLRVASLANGGASSPVGASSAAPGNLVIGMGTLHITGPAATDRGYTLRTVDTTRAAVLRVDDEVTFGGQILADSGAFVKAGLGTVTYTYPGANQLNRHSNSGGAGGVQNIGAYGDSPTTGFTGFTVSQGKVVLGVPGQTNSAVRIEIGSRTTTAAGQETAGEIVLNNGVLNSSDTVSIGRNNGTTTTAPDGASSRLTVNGGICNFPILATGNNGAGLSGYNARPVIEVNGGQVNVSGPYLSVGESAGASASVFVSGGTVNIYNANCDLRIGGGQGATDNSGSGTVRLSGGGLIHVARNVSLGFGNNGQGEFHLDGGTLRALTITGGNGSRKEFWFNGGVFLPHTAGQTMSGLTAAYVSTNGAAIDTSLADYTVAQDLLHAPALGAAKDGGLVKLSTNTLSLTGAANTFDGPIRVAEGLLRARLGGTNSLFVAAGAAFDALGETCTVGNLTGNGLLTNGVIRVAGRLDAGTNGAPAGASMTVRNLSLAGGCTFACDWATNALGQVVNDTVAVTGTLAPEAPGFFDLGRDESDPITLPFRLTLMTYGTFSGSFHGWKAVNTGLPANTRYATVATAANGTVTLEVRYSGTIILVK